MGVVAGDWVALGGTAVSVAAGIMGVSRTKDFVRGKVGVIVLVGVGLKGVPFHFPNFRNTSIYSKQKIFSLTIYSISEYNFCFPALTLS